MCYVCAYNYMCLCNLFQNINKQYTSNCWIHSLYNYTLVANHVRFKVHESIFLILVLWTLSCVISLQDSTVQDVIARCRTHKSKCVISLYVIVVGSFYVWGCRDSCHNLVLDIRLDGLCLANAWVFNLPYFHSYCFIHMYFSTPINFKTVSFYKWLRISRAS